jgi:hypothetical protein
MSVEGEGRGPGWAARPHGSGRDFVGGLDGYGRYARRGLQVQVSDRF